MTSITTKAADFNRRRTSLSKQLKTKRKQTRMVTSDMKKDNRESAMSQSVIKEKKRKENKL